MATLQKISLQTRARMEGQKANQMEGSSQAEGLGSFPRNISSQASGYQKTVLKTSGLL